jgi:HK97 family phage major capsid protein
VIKSLMESDPSFEALLPEAEAATSAASADDVQHNAVENPVTEEKSIVSEEKSVETVDYGSLLNEIKSLRSELSVQAPINAPAVNLKTRRGDDETKATAYYIRTGDVGALKASNNTDMNIGTNADGGFAVPTGHYQGIIERLSEMRIDSQLGVQRIPGRGTTVNVPVSAASPNVFVQTSEASAFDRDAPTLGRVQMTLVKYTKTIEVSDELMDDEDSNLMSFVSNQVGQAMALTYNSLLLTELRASGTAALTLDSATTIGQGEIPELLYKLKSEYRTNASWVLGPSAIQIIRSLTSSNDFQFPPIQVRPTGQELLWGYPVVETTYGSNVAASAKSMIFGNFSYVGVRDGGIQFMRNPYLLANTGQVALHYYFRVVYKVLQSEAIVYATHPSA